MAILNSANFVELADVAALQGYAVEPKSNDHIQISNGAGLYWFDQGATDPDDGDFVIEQTSFAGLGRWRKYVSAKRVVSATIALEDTLAGETSNKKDYVVTGVSLADFNLASVVSASVPDGMLITECRVSGTDLFHIDYENQSGSPFTGQTIDVKVLVF